MQGTIQVLGLFLPKIWLFIDFSVIINIERMQVRLICFEHIQNTQCTHTIN